MRFYITILFVCFVSLLNTVNAQESAAPTEEQQQQALPQLNEPM